jgi:O-antigen/teichoic acid export membrane protein
VSSLWTQKRLSQLQRSVESILRMTALFVLPAGLGLSVMSGPILQLLFGADRPETAIAAPLLSVMGIAAIFVGITIPVNSMLQGMGLAYLPVKLMAVGGAIKIAVNYMLVGMPGINIKGAPFGTLACYCLSWRPSDDIFLTREYILIITGIWQALVCRSDLRFFARFAYRSTPLAYGQPEYDSIGGCPRIIICAGHNRSITRK